MTPYQREAVRRTRTDASPRAMKEASAVGIWNSWFTSAIYLMDRSKWPIQLFLREVLINNSQKSLESGVKASAESLQTLVKYAITVVATLPILCIYPFAQRHFVKGVMIGSIKG